jgi:hypothetical protein
VTERVLVAGTEAQPERRADQRHTGADAAWRFLIWVGLALALVGWADVTLTWYPPRWASLEWELGTISSTFDALPLGTLGLAMVAAGLVARGHARAARVEAIVVAVITLALAVMLVMFLLDVPPALRIVNPAVRAALKKSLVKTGFIAVLYIVTYAAMTRWLWKASRVGTRKGAGS